MDQLAAMLARATVPSGTSSSSGVANPSTEGDAPPAPLFLEGTSETPDREVCRFFLNPQLHLQMGIYFIRVG